MKLINGLLMRISLVWLVVITVIFIFTSSASALLNPAAVYCQALGYNYFSAETKRGNIGACELPNGLVVNAWAFFSGKGKIALEWSYCAQKGYEAKRDESGAVCHDCLVCVMPDNQEIWVAELMGLNFKESNCGDERCGTAENYDNCPEDCPSGGKDEACDGVADTQCDPDCVSRGGFDSDCPGLFIDIMPGSCSNPLGIKKKGVLPIVLLGTVNLNITDIDPDTIQLSYEGVTGSLTPSRWKVEDIGTPNPTQGCGECWNVPGDRRMDLVLKFNVAALIKMLGPESLSGQTVTLKITAKLKNGTEVSGYDCVHGVP